MQANKDADNCTYRTVRKRVKNINLHVGDDGEVWVSAPPGTPQTAIDAFVHSKADWILHAKERIARRESLPFFDQSSVLLLGERIRVCAEQGNRRVALLRDGVLHVILPNPHDADALKKAVDEWLFSYSIRIFSVMGSELLGEFARYQLSPAQLRPRRMTARWGSCHPKTGVILLSHRLICTPPACVRYVVAHELAHLVYPNHSRAFYSLVSEVMPDHKAHSAMLKQYTGVLR